jgi:hypothetical protein
MHDPVATLREADCPVDLLSEAQREVIASLTEQEAEILVSIQQRLRDAEAEGEVTGHNYKLL